MQTYRYFVQFVFLGITLFAVFAVQGNAEAWCPFGGIEALYLYIQEGVMPCSLNISNFYILASVLILTIVMRRVFCGYVCPIGTISEWIGKLGKWMQLPQWKVSKVPNFWLSWLKYPILGLILYFTYQTGELWFRGIDPCYALLSRHGEDITFWAYVVCGIIALASLLISVPFCRWLCPLAAALNPISRFGLTTVQRNVAQCIQCQKCAQICPMAIPVAQMTEVNQSRCTSCLQCVDQCPVPKTLTWGPSLETQHPALMTWPRWILFVLLFLVLTAGIGLYQAFPLPGFIKFRGEPAASTAQIHLEIQNLTCRGRANLLFYFLTRDDHYAVPGYLQLEVWPHPQQGKARITYDPQQTNAEAIAEAILEPYFDIEQNIWRESPFQILGP